MSFSKDSGLVLKKSIKSYTKINVELWH